MYEVALSQPRGVKSLLRKREERAGLEGQGPHDRGLSVEERHRGPGLQQNQSLFPEFPTLGQCRQRAV